MINIQTDSFTNNKFITWFSRINLYAWACFLLYRILDTLWQFRNHIPVIDESLTYIFVENVLQYGRFRTGVLPSSVNYNPEAPVYIYITYALEMLLRMPFHILSHLFGDTRITKLAPAFYLIVLLAIFIPRIQKKGKEEYALVVGISIAMLAMMQTVANAFFRIRYFPFLYIFIFTCVMLYAHLYTKPLSAKRIILMLSISVLPCLIHLFAFVVTVPMLLGVLFKLVQDKGITFRSTLVAFIAAKLWQKSLIISAILVASLFAVVVVFPMIQIILNQSDWFSLRFLMNYLRTFTGPSFFHILAYIFVIVFVFLQNKKLSDFLRTLYFICLTGIVFLASIVFITGNNRFADTRYDITSHVLMSIIVAIFIILLIHHIISFIKSIKDRACHCFLHKDIVKMIFSVFAIMLVVFLSLSTSRYKSHNHALQIFFPEDFLNLTYGIENYNISPENLYIITDNPGYFFTHNLDSRVFFVRPLLPELDYLAPGQRTADRIFMSRAFFRDYDGWVYSHISLPWFVTIADWYRLLSEINMEQAADSYIALGLRRQGLRITCDELAYLFEAIGMPTNYMPLSIIDIINRMHINGFYIPDHLATIIAIEN